MKIEKVIVWGHKLHTNTFSYVHGSFVKAFKHMGYETYWMDKDDDLSKFDFTNSLFLTEGQVIEKMPIREDCFYVLHNVEHKIHKQIPSSNKLIIQVYTTDCINRDKPDSSKKMHYFNDGIVYFPWATDLLPHEIDENIKNLEQQKTERCVYFIGMITEPWHNLSKELKKHNIKFVASGGTFDKNNKNNKSFEENKILIQKSIIAPALQTDWQVEHGYIPCRIFKNISYGKMGLTNSIHVNKLFDNKLIHDVNIPNMVKKGIEFEKNPNKREIVKSLMENVRDNHTYINRIEYIQWYMKEFLEIHLN